jgi:Kef-type K+ transport system membrane component KefB
MPHAVHIAVDPLTHFLLAVALLVLVCHLLGGLMVRLRQPAVVGEILGGIMLGPSLLGEFWPGGNHWLFSGSVPGALDAAGQLGLALFMFLLGSEPMTRIPNRGRAIGLLIIGSSGVAFAAGIGFALVSGDTLAGFQAGLTHVLFMGLAVSITAMPVLARVLMDLGMSRTPEGTLALAGSAVGDGIAWSVLTVVLLATGVGSLAQAGVRAALTVVFLLVTVFGVRPVAARLIARFDSHDSVVLSALLVSGALGYAAVTQMLGLHQIVGAFLFGVIIPRDSAAMSRLRERLNGFALTVLLPLFFAGVGLNTAVGLLGASAWRWLLLVMLLLVSATKFAGAATAGRLVGLPSVGALRLGVLMNCRGVTEIVVASVGFQYHLINRLGLTMLVLMAVLTTAMTGPLVRALGLPAQTADQEAVVTAALSRRRRRWGTRDRSGAAGGQGGGDTQAAWRWGQDPGSADGHRKPRGHTRLVRFRNRSWW